MPDHGLKITDHGLKITDHGLKITDHGLKITEINRPVLQNYGIFNIIRPWSPIIDHGRRYKPLKSDMHVNTCM
jgi:hypothetical protein